MGDRQDRNVLRFISQTLDIRSPTIHKLTDGQTFPLRSSIKEVTERWRAL
jgi:hypothetical protein